MENKIRIASYGPNEEVLVDRLDDDCGIYVITMNDPDSFNTMSVPWMKAVAEAFNAMSERLDPDPNNDEVRAIILRGEGPGFAIGLDVSNLDDYFSGGISGETDPWKAIWDCPFPVIGAVNGPAVTGGFEIATACDVLLASPRAVFMDNHAKYGVHPGRRLSQRLIHIVGVNNAKFVTMSSFPIEANLAHTMGLVQQIYQTNEELEHAAIDLSRMISKNHPMMVKRYKSLIDQGVMGTYAEGLALEKESDNTFYEELTNLQATLADGGTKFRELVAWVAARK